MKLFRVTKKIYVSVTVHASTESEAEEIASALIHSALAPTDAGIEGFNSDLQEGFPGAKVVDAEMNESRHSKDFKTQTVTLPPPPSYLIH